MKKKYPPISAKNPHVFHGGDYNPEQWLDTPSIIDEDMRLMKLSGCNTMSVGIFSWAMLEPEEGKYNFEWLDNIMDRLYENGCYAILATPSGARPAWLSQKYPEVLRVDEDRQRRLHGGRHNHCFTSPVYREKVEKINRMLAQRYKNHPALIAWHVSNEYSGGCHCKLCQEAFRKFLKNKYGNDIEKLNHEWWTRFWSHTFTDWSQIESPSQSGEHELPALTLDWKRFVTMQTLDFYKAEVAPLKEVTPEIPVTSNFMELNEELDYREFADYLDFASWDCYPSWHNAELKTKDVAIWSAFTHDLYRSLKGKPFVEMESTPSLVNWQPVNKLKKPGMHFLSSMQAVAHGADGVMYFQWRKSRGGFEKFHGAVVDHCGHEYTRVFADVSEVGRALKKLDGITGTVTQAQTAIIYDWQNRWAIEEAQALRKGNKDYLKTCMEQYRPFWENGVPVDVIGEENDFSRYKLLIAPMLYMVRPGVAERIEEFVENGGTLVVTYWSGLVNENDLCFLGGFPGPLRSVTGIWAEETDSLYDSEENSIDFLSNALGLSGSYRVRDYCDLIHAEKARVLAVYGSDFYRGRPALTVNSFGKGKAYYIAARADGVFNKSFYGGLIKSLELKKAIAAELPDGVTAQMRTDGENEFVFAMNFSEEEKSIESHERFTDMLTGERLGGEIELPPYGVKILKRQKIAP